MNVRVTKYDHWSVEGDDDTVLDVILWVRLMEHEHAEETEVLQNS